MKEDRTSSTIDVEVRYAETDQMGVVHHSNYLVWFELARTGLCNLSGFHYAEIEERGYFLMVVGAHLRYRKGARYGDHLQVSASIDRLGSRGLHFAYEVMRGDELLASGVTEHVWVEKKSGRPCKTPEFIRGPFAEMAGIPPDSHRKQR